jgi:hypothetical protein
MLKLSYAALSLGMLALLPWPVHGQTDGKGEKVRITTVDGVELNAVLYACKDAKIKNPPTILMLHPIGESSSKKPWVGLAETLRSKATVMIFDFRGHGLSTEISPELFWKQPFNRDVRHIKNAIKAAAEGKQTLEFKEMEKLYYPALINDIAACKCFLDRMNDKGGCNTSSFIVIGADTGATLGAIWVNSEWHRHRVVTNPALLAQAPDPRPEGPDIIACVWLSASSQLGARSVSFGATLDVPLRVKAAPMVFIYGDEDAKAKAVATAALKFKGPKEKVKYPFTDKVEIAKAGTLRGMELLQKSLGVDRAIEAYLFGGDDSQGVVEAKGREWTDREFRKTQYIWRMPGSPITSLGTSAKAIGDTNFVFDAYLKYAK